MTYSKVEDPNILAQLNKGYTQVTDPNILSQLNEVSNTKAEEPESFLSKLPRNIAIGLTHLGRDIHNLPHDQVKSLENLFQGLGQGIKTPLTDMQQPKHKNISDYLPNDTQNYGDIFGQKGEGTLMDRILQKGVEYAPEVGMGASALYHLPITKFPGTRVLKEVKKQMQERNVGNLKVPESIFKDIEQNKFLSNTQPNRNLLEKAREGGYNDLFNLQSDLGGVERSHTRDLFNSANRQFGKDVGANRQELLGAMKDELSKLGHEDLAEMLSHGQNLYRQYMKFRPYRNAALGLGLSSIPGFSILKKLMP